eukprot:Opistho-1_new@37691
MLRQKQKRNDHADGQVHLNCRQRKHDVRILVDGEVDDQLNDGGDEEPVVHRKRDEAGLVERVGRLPDQKGEAHSVKEDEQLAEHDGVVPPVRATLLVNLVVDEHVPRRRLGYREAGGDLDRRRARGRPHDHVYDEHSDDHRQVLEEQAVPQADLLVELRVENDSDTLCLEHERSEHESKADMNAPLLHGAEGSRGGRVREEHPRVRDARPAKNHKQKRRACRLENLLLPREVHAYHHEDREADEQTPQHEEEDVHAVDAVVRRGGRHAQGKRRLRNRLPVVQDGDVVHARGRKGEFDGIPLAQIEGVCDGMDCHDAAAQCERDHKRLSVLDGRIVPVAIRAVDPEARRISGDRAL